MLSTFNLLIFLIVIITVVSCHVIIIVCHVISLLLLLLSVCFSVYLLVCFVVTFFCMLCLPHLLCYNFIIILSPIHLYFTCNFYNFILFQLGALVVAHWASGLSSIIMIPYHTIPYRTVCKERVQFAVITSQQLHLRRLNYFTCTTGSLNHALLTMYGFRL